MSSQVSSLAAVPHLLALATTAEGIREWRRYPDKLDPIPMFGLVVLQMEFPIPKINSRFVSVFSFFFSSPLSERRLFSPLSGLTFSSNRSPKSVFFYFLPFLVVHLRFDMHLFPTSLNRR